MRNRRTGDQLLPATYSARAAAIICLLFALPGCMPRLDPQEYGETVTDLRKLKESKQEFELPDLTPLDDPTPAVLPDSPLPGPGAAPQTPPAEAAGPSSSPAAPVVPEESPK